MLIVLARHLALRPSALIARVPCLLSQMWTIMAIATESAKHNKVLDVWSCCILHNLYMRYRKREYLLVDPVYAAEQAEFTALAQQVMEEVDALHADEDRPGQVVEEEVDLGDARALPEYGLSEADLRDAGVALRDEVCRTMWARARR